MNAVVQHSPQQGLIPRNMPEAMQLAEMMARGQMMPGHLKNPGDALMVVEQAMRWQMSPFAVAQNTFNIKGKLLFSGTIVHAAIENSGAITGLLDYQFSGEGATRKVTVSATRRGEKDPRTVEVVLKDAITENNIWKKQPDQQLCYHAVRVWARRWTPGVMLGVYTPEEWPTQQAEFSGTTIDAAPESRILSTEAVLGDEIPDRVMNPKPKGRTARQYLDELQKTLSACHTEWEIEAVGASEDVTKAKGWLTGAAQHELTGMLAEALERVRQSEGAADEPVIEETAE